ncbi:MAG: RNA-protein complex protein Nop10 [Candidatus Micrarchaeota archaeon]|nr:RNA-protein complex protein Nop10 [Candidatus Micrarchaeota archaeon]
MKKSDAIKSVLIKKIRKCNICKKYTLKDVCCGKLTIKIHPPIFKFNLRLLNYFIKSKIEHDN